MWKYTHSNELYHYGVPGMKWGVRKARQIANIGIGIKRRQNKRDYDLDKLKRTIDPTTSPGEKIKKNKQAKTEYKDNDTKLAWKQAKNKAKIDSNYKNSDEYRKIKQENAKVVVKETLRKLADASVKRG